MLPAPIAAFQPTSQWMPPLQGSLMTAGMTSRAPERSVLGRIQATAGSPAMEIDPRVIGEGLGLEPAQAQALMQAEKITLLCERGTGADQGWHRVRFYYAGRRFVILIDPSGRILEG